MRRVALVATLFLAGPGLAQDYVLPEVRAVMERVNTPAGDYSVVRTLRLTEEGHATREWTGAEYRRGPMLRTEVGPYREIENCETGERSYYSPTDDAIRSTPPFLAGCYLPGLEPLTSTRMLPRVRGPWGRADVIEVTGQNFVSRFVVTEDGILVSYVNRPRPGRSGGVTIETRRVVVTRGTPDAAIFEPESLRRAVTQPLPANAPRAP